MIALFAIVAVIGIVFLLGINFYPPLKERWGKWAIPLESLISTAIYYFGQITDAFRAAQAAGYLPDDWKGYLPYVFAAYLFIKTIQEAAAARKAAAAVAPK